MLNDVFKEQLVKKEPDRKDLVKKAGIIGVAVLLAVAACFLVPGFAAFIIAAVAFGAHYCLGFLKVEYEYVLTNGELDIDCVYNMSKRKRVFSGDVKSFEIMAQLEDKTHEGDFRVAQETRDYSSGKISENTYAFLTTYKDKRLKVIIEPNEKLLQAFSAFLPPRKLIKK